MDPIEAFHHVFSLTHPDNEMMFAFAEDRLPPAQLRMVERHLAHCPDCRVIATSLGWSPKPLQEAEIISISRDQRAKAPQPETRQTNLPVRGSFVQKLAAASKEGTAQRPDGDADADAYIQPVPGASDGEASLGYLCNSELDCVVISGAGDGPIRVQLGDTEYAVASGAVDQPRIVEGLNRQQVMIWLASGRRNGFALVRL